MTTGCVVKMVASQGHGVAVVTVAVETEGTNTVIITAATMVAAVVVVLS
jgi:hypothetical protein